MEINVASIEKFISENEKKLSELFIANYRLKLVSTLKSNKLRNIKTNNSIFDKTLDNLLK